MDPSARYVVGDRPYVTNPDGPGYAKALYSGLSGDALIHFGTHTVQSDKALGSVIDATTYKNGEYFLLTTGLYKANSSKSALILVKSIDIIEGVLLSNENACVLVDYPLRLVVFNLEGVIIRSINLEKEFKLEAWGAPWDFVASQERKKAYVIFTDGQILSDSGQKFYTVEPVDGLVSNNSAMRSNCLFDENNLKLLVFQDFDRVSILNVRKR